MTSLRGPNRELYEFPLGSQPEPERSAAQRAVTAAPAAGLKAVDLREQTTRVEFSDVAAVVHVLRLAREYVSKMS